MVRYAFWELDHVLLHGQLHAELTPNRTIAKPDLPSSIAPLFTLRAPFERTGVRQVIEHLALQARALHEAGDRCVIAIGLALGDYGLCGCRSHTAHVQEAEP